ncbi:hypothetical protein CDAR_28851 [Caerostris darwini]|uniref:Uncharacterized protein n=1 Tax=Caerostris darwini TaxID=1538125 RepID=A0AAV4N8K1_9ARAC|nr:hypothetical protein CDAR_28851 [Caerostris darwini]
MNTDLSEVLNKRSQEVHMEGVPPSSAWATQGYSGLRAYLRRRHRNFRFVVSLSRCSYFSSRYPIAANGYAFQWTLFHIEKRLKAQKKPNFIEWEINSVRCFEETGSFEDRPRSECPFFSVNSTHVVKSVMEELVADTSRGVVMNCQAWENNWDSGMVNSIYSAQNPGYLYLHKMQALHQLLPPDTDAKLNFATWS